MSALELFPNTKEFWFDVRELTIFNLNSMMESAFFDRIEWPYVIITREKISGMKKKKIPNYQVNFS